MNLGEVLAGGTAMIIGAVISLIALGGFAYGMYLAFAHIGQTWPVLLIVIGFPALLLTWAWRSGEL